MAIRSLLCRGSLQRDAHRLRYCQTRVVSSFRLNCRSKLTQAQVDEAVAEMNAEMNDLFGGGIGSPTGGTRSPFDNVQGDFEIHTAATTNSAAGSRARVEHSTPTGSAQCSAHALSSSRTETVAVLEDKIAWCTRELRDARDTTRIASLASCIAECARASAALR
mmetsp:Transcript_4663/g.10127  ORF Transcript_4663/g.10127 Transcript_4663/m.10127 type:complete len:164 (+) Transcript_4663:409-900(+)